MSESILVVDEDNRPEGTASREDVWRYDLCHRIVRLVVVTDECERSRQMLLQRRAPNKKPYNGAWQESAAGHVNSEDAAAELNGQASDLETCLRAIRREASEEIDWQGADLQFIDKYRSRGHTGWRKLNRLNYVFGAHLPLAEALQLQTKEPQSDEVAEVKLWPIAAIRANLQQPTLNEESFTPSLGIIMRKYYP